MIAFHILAGLHLASLPKVEEGGGGDQEKMVVPMVVLLLVGRAKENAPQ